MRFERPIVSDYGSIAAHTFTRCATGDPVEGAPPKDLEDYPLDSHGECSAGHALS